MSNQDLIQKAHNSTANCNTILRACLLIGLDKATSDVLLEQLRGACAAMQELSNRLHGNEPAKIGE